MSVFLSVCLSIHLHTNKLSDRQAYRQIDIETNRHRDGHTDRRTYTHISTHKLKNVCVCVCVCVRVRVRVCVCVCVIKDIRKCKNNYKETDVTKYTSTCIHIYNQTDREDTHTRTHTRTHARTHTYTYTDRQVGTPYF